MPENLSTGRLELVNASIVADNLRFHFAYQKVVGVGSGNWVVRLDEPTDICNFRTSVGQHKEEKQCLQHA